MNVVGIDVGARSDAVRTKSRQIRRRIKQRTVLIIWLEGLWINIRLQRQHPCHLVLIVIVNVVVDGIAGELHLAKAQMSGRRFGDVHDFAVGRNHKYETVECLQQIRAELFDGGHS